MKTWISIMNGTWQSAPSIPIALFLISVTLVIECGVVWAFGRSRQYKNLDLLIFVVFGANLLTGILGLILGLWR